MLILSSPTHGANRLGTYEQYKNPSFKPHTWGKPDIFDEKTFYTLHFNTFYILNPKFFSMF